MASFLIQSAKLLLHALQVVAIMSSSAIAGSSRSQTDVVMPTITHPSVSPSQSTRLNSIMLKHAHHFYFPLNTISLLSNSLVFLIWLISYQFSTTEIPSILVTLRALAPALLSLLCTTHTVKWILPINERMHSLASEADNGVLEKKADVQEAQEKEVRDLQRRWERLNDVRGLFLFAIAIGSVTSPAAASLYSVAAA